MTTDDPMGYSGAEEPWSDPRATAAAERSAGLSRKVRKQMTRLTLWCPRNECQVAAVYRMSEGHLLKSSGQGVEAQDRHDDRHEDDREGAYMTRSAPVILEDVLSELRDLDVMDRTIPTAYAVRCRCQPEGPRFVDLRKLVLLFWRWDPEARNVLINDSRLV